MFNLLRTARVSNAPLRSFSTTAIRRSDVAKLILVGRMGKEAEIRTTAGGKEYVSYLVATTNYPPPPPNPDGSRPSARTSWHHVFSFNPSSFDYLRSLAKGSLVYVEANYELREADPTAEPESPQAQRQIFLRHETVRLIKSAKSSTSEGTETESSQVD